MHLRKDNYVAGAESLWNISVLDVNVEVDSRVKLTRENELGVQGRNSAKLSRLFPFK